MRARDTYEHTYKIARAVKEGDIELARDVRGKQMIFLCTCAYASCTYVFRGSMARVHQTHDHNTGTPRTSYQNRIETDSRGSALSLPQKFLDPWRGRPFLLCVRIHYVSLCLHHI